MSKEEFTSRWGLIVSVIGIAVGTGNIWRFPRIVASNGGDSFLLPWVIFLFVWSIPLIMAEFALGKMARSGTVGTFARVVGKKYAWMGMFVGFVATAIMFYYSVVSGWCLRYLSLALTGQLIGASDHNAFGTALLNRRGNRFSFISSWYDYLMQYITMVAVTAIVWGGFLLCLTIALRKEKEKSNSSAS